MLHTIVEWLDRAGPVVFWTCLALLVTIDAAAVATVVGTRSRELVNRWTGPVLIANVLLLGTGVGVPAMMYAAKVAVAAVAPAVPIQLDASSLEP